MKESVITIDEYLALSQKYSKLKADFKVINNIVKILTYCCGNTVKDNWSATDEQKLKNFEELRKIIVLLMRTHMFHIAKKPDEFEKELKDLQDFSKDFFKEMSKESFDPMGFGFIEKLINFDNSSQSAFQESGTTK